MLVMEKMFSGIILLNTISIYPQISWLHSFGLNISIIIYSIIKSTKNIIGLIISDFEI